MVQPSGSATGIDGSHGTSGTVKLNGRTVQIIKLLGEGGFSFVYLARDRESGREFALKKVSLLVLWNAPVLLPSFCRCDVTQALTRFLWLLQRLKHIADSEASTSCLC